MGSVVVMASGVGASTLAELDHLELMQNLNSLLSEGQVEAEGEGDDLTSLVEAAAQALQGPVEQQLPAQSHGPASNLVQYSSSSCSEASASPASIPGAVSAQFQDTSASPASDSGPVPMQFQDTSVCPESASGVVPAEFHCPNSAQGLEQQHQQHQVVAGTPLQETLKQEPAAGGLDAG